MKSAFSSACGWAGRLGAVLAIAVGSLTAQPASAQDRPLSTAPYRYIPAPSGRLDSLEQQKAYSYRNDLSAQQRGMVMDRTLNRNFDSNAASSLRREGELTREGGRMDRVLQR